MPYISKLKGLIISHFLFKGKPVHDFIIINSVQRLKILTDISGYGNKEPEVEYSDE